MDSTTDAVGIEVRREIEIAASPETVWELLVDPARAQLWWGSAIVLEPEPGGELRIAVTPRSVASGRVVEATPPRRLVFTFGWEVGGAGPELVPPGSSTVEVDLVPTGAGTTVRLLHRGLPSPEAGASHDEGWAHYLGRLAVVAGGGDPGPDPWAAGA